MQSFRKVVETDLVKGYKCPCGAVMPPKLEIAHKLECQHPKANAGKHIVMPDPRYLLVGTSHGPMILEGVEPAFDSATGDFPRLVKEEDKNNA